MPCARAGVLPRPKITGGTSGASDVDSSRGSSGLRGRRNISLSDLSVTRTCHGRKGHLCYTRINYTHAGCSYDQNFVRRFVRRDVLLRILDDVQLRAVLSNCHLHRRASLFVLVTRRIAENSSLLCCAISDRTIRLCYTVSGLVLKSTA